MKNRIPRTSPLPRGLRDIIRDLVETGLTLDNLAYLAGMREVFGFATIESLVDCALAESEVQQ